MMIYEKACKISGRTDCRVEIAATRNDSLLYVSMDTILGALTTAVLYGLDLALFNEEYIRERGFSVTKVSSSYF